MYAPDERILYMCCVRARERDFLWCHGATTHGPQEQPKETQQHFHNDDHRNDNVSFFLA